MIRRALVVTVLAISVVSVDPASAGECHWQESTSLQDGVAHVEVVQVCSGGAEETSLTSDQHAPPSDSNLDTICVATAISLGRDPFDYCGIPAEDAEATITPGLVAAAFQQIPLPASELSVQPANGRTLVNFDTNFFTDTAPFDRTVTLLGQRVDLHIVPSAFGWRFGDGAALASRDAGAPYPDLRITHAYQRKGSVQPAVDTTYTATYRVNGGSWAAVPGSVTVPGASVGLQVLTATPVLVGSRHR